MKSTCLYGAHELSDAEIDAHVGKSGIGCYALGEISAENLFVVRRVGRSDVGLNGRLHDYVPLNRYDNFKYGFFNTVKQCYEHECRMWHDFHPTDNANHPDKPNGANYDCPYPGCPL